jgi:hypothetical protein
LLLVAERVVERLQITQDQLRVVERVVIELQL